VIVAVAAVGIATLAPWRRSFERAPGVLLLSIDTLRADAVGFHAGRDLRTPRLDALAAESVVFEQATAAANHTAPSHASMLTGASPASHGVVNTVQSAPTRIPDKLETLAERFRSEGYKTFAATDGGYMRAEFGFNRGFDTFTSENRGLAQNAGAALAWIDRQGSSPWFVFLHTYDVHGPYPLPRPLAQRVLDKYPDSWVPAEYGAFYGAAANDRFGRAIDFLRDPKRYGARDVECIRDLYAATVEALDRRLGAVIDELKKRQVWDSLLLVVTSDHGEEFLEHGQLQHEQLFDEVMRVPLIVKLPKRLGAGLRASWPFPGIDLTPTIAEAAGLGEPKGLEGISHAGAVRALAKNPASVKPPRAVAYGNQFESEARRSDVARTPAMKLFALRTDRQAAFRLFDLTTDPGEKHGLGAESRPDAKALVEGLRDREDVWNATFEILRGSAVRGERSEALDRDLRNLGYTK
jgi:arylsulfatase